MRKVNYNDISRFALDKKIEQPLFNYFNDLTKSDWNYYRDLIIDHWLNTKNSNQGISVPGILQKINNISTKVNDPELNEQDRDRAKAKFRSGNKLKSGDFTFDDLKIFLNFSDPVEILIAIYKKDLRKNIVISDPNSIKKAASYLNSKRSEQYHPESSGIYHQIPFNETDLRQILAKGYEMFRLIGNTASAGTLEFYLTDISELNNEWLTSSALIKSKEVYSNLPKRKHIEWGFVGYKDETEELISKLSKGNRRLFQIVGQGGSGKSALANEVCHQIKIRFNQELKFDSFIWITSKSDVLNSSEIKDIGKGTRYKNYEDLLSQLFLALNEDNILEFEDFKDFDENELETEIIQFLNGSDGKKRLIVIDNLENISKDNQKKIIRFLDDNVSTPNYIIITTRHRIIDEFPAVTVPIGGLGKKFGIELFLKLIDYNQIDFKISSKKDRDNVEQYVELANYYPLAIKYCIEKCKKDNISLKTSFETCRNGSSDLHRFIFRDTYSSLESNEKRVLKTIVLYKTSLNHDIDKQVLRKITAIAYKNISVEDSLRTLYEKTLVEYIGLSDDDIQVVLTDLVASHIEDIIKRHEMDTTRIQNAIKGFIESQNLSANSDNFQVDMRTSNIQKNKFLEALKYLNNRLRLETIINEIESYSSTFYGLGYLKAKYLQVNLTTTNSSLKKKINDYYLDSIRLKPEQSIFWTDYVKFLEKYYPSSYNIKLKPLFPSMINELFANSNSNSKLNFANAIIKVIEMTKMKDEYTLQFWEFVLTNQIKIDYNKKQLSLYRFFLSEWLKKNTKTKYLDLAVMSDELNTLLIKNDFQLHKKICTKLKEYNDAS